MEILTLEKAVVSNLVIAASSDSGLPGAFAASELAGYLGKAFSLEIPVLGEEEGRDAPLLFLLRKVKEDPSIKFDGFRIAFSGKRIILSACEERGLLNGVYTVLSRNGFRWGWPGKKYEVIPELSRLILEESVTNPDLEFRGACVFPLCKENLEEVRETLIWLSRNRFNLFLTCVSKTRGRKNDWHVEWNSVAEELYPELEKRGMILNMGEHSNRYFFPLSLFEEHPEWFAMDKEGVRNNKGQICYSNEEAVAYLKKSYLEYIKQHPEIHIFGTWPEDGYGYCQCEDCKKPGRILQAVNEIAKEVAKVRPDLMVEYLSYTDETCKVPPELPVEKNMITLVSRIAMVEDWKKRSDKAGACGVYLLHYGLSDNFAETANLPLRIDAVSADCREAFEKGVRGIVPFLIGPDTYFRTFFNLYFFSRFSWETGLSSEQALLELCEGYYGSAAKDMALLFRKLEKLPRVTFSPQISGELWQDREELEKVYDGEVFAAAKKTLEETKAFAGSLREIYPENKFLLLSIASAEKLISFQERFFDAWHFRVLAVKAFRKGEREKVKEFIGSCVKLELLLREEVRGKDRLAYGVAGDLLDFDYFLHWRLQLDKALYEMRTEENRLPFDLDPDPTTEFFPAGSFSGEE